MVTIISTGFERKHPPALACRRVAEQAGQRKDKVLFADLADMGKSEVDTSTAMLEHSGLDIALTITLNGSPKKDELLDLLASQGDMGIMIVLATSRQIQDIMGYSGLGGQINLPGSFVVIRRGSADSWHLPTAIAA